MELKRIQADWQNILNDPVVTTGCKSTFSYSLPIHLGGNTLYLVLPEKKWENHFKYESFNLKQLSRAVSNYLNQVIDCKIISSKPQIPVFDTELKESVGYAVESLTHMTMRDFQQEGRKRTPQDYIVDTIEGKLSEYIFNRFFQFCTGYCFSVDTNIYKSTTETDGGNDLQILYSKDSKYLSNLKVDLKATKSKHMWLLVEETKAMADVYVLMRMQFVNEDALNNVYIDMEQVHIKSYKNNIKDEILQVLKGKYSGEVSGFAYMSDIIDPVNKKPWVKFKRAKKKALLFPRELDKIMVSDPEVIWELQEIYRDSLTFMDTELKAEWNYGVPVLMLRNTPSDWNNLFRKITIMMIDYKDQLYPLRWPHLWNRSTEDVQRQKLDATRLLQNFRRD
ncbi:hypothetical protein ACFQZT_16765 [Paenibacillus sp. GCM10027628]|uniref:hypothetical protein n=1 Tax=Paenibacillus sp. GCM10027628 TaxID=3273413 RepID=UPI003627F087